MTRGARHAFIVVAVAVTLVAAASPVFTVTYANSTAARQDATIAQLRQQQLAACGFAYDLGTVRLPSSPRPSRFGVSIVTDSRAWWYRNDCPGTLPVPPGLAHWAQVYHLPGN